VPGITRIPLTSFVSKLDLEQRQHATTTTLAAGVKLWAQLMERQPTSQQRCN